MNILGIVLGSFICLGSVGSYIPQFYKIIKSNSVKGISEISLVIQNVGLMCLTMNALIFSWDSITTLDYLNLLPFFQILISWLMVLVYYLIFIIYKFKNYEKRILSGLKYVFTYLFFAIFVIALALGEKYRPQRNFFQIFADVLGYSSAVCNGFVYLPQIYLLYKEKDSGSLSFLTFIIQTPGNVVIIVFQAVIYNAAVSTWITYLIVFVEQSIILMQMTYYHFRKDRELENVIVG